MSRIAILSVLCVLIVPGQGMAAEGVPADARRLLLTGKYAEAAEIYRPLAAKEPAAAIGLARCLAAEGKLDEAQRTLLACEEMGTGTSPRGVSPPSSRKGSEPVPISSQAPARRAAIQDELARLAFERGDYAKARAAADESLRLETNHVLARWIAAELDRTAGRLDEAQRGYRWLIRYYNDHDLKDAESLHWIGLGAAQHARWSRASDQFHFLVNELYPDIVKLEPSYWPAHYEAGLLFLEKHNKADAGREFRAALAVNPRAAEVHAALAQLAMEDHDLEQAGTAIRQALEINPQLLDAWLLKADLAWANFEVAETLSLLQEKVLPLCPVREETLGRIAACYVLQDGLPKEGRPPGIGSKEGPPSRLAQLTDEVARRNARPGEFYFTLAAVLDARNKQAEAERFLREAARVMPQLVGPKAHLGMLLMRMGREDEAGKLLKEAFDADAFDLRVKNTLDVLEVLEGFTAHQGDGFVLKYDPQLDKALAQLAVRHVAKVYPELCRRFGYRPPGKAAVEIFNQARGLGGHQWFSARMVGLPYLGTVAASTGRIVALVSPGDPQLHHRFQWTRVLTHELVHVITIQQTDFNIPHWFTEGLAVTSENCPRPPAWNELLVDRVPRGKLFNLRSINPAFSRPQSSADWQMAYCQAVLYVEFMQAQFGPEAVRKLLAAYTAARATPEAIRQSFGVSEEEFERQYTAYVKKVAAGLRTLKRPERSFAELLPLSRQQPDDADVAAELAHAYLQRRAEREATESAQRALKLRAKHPLATYVLARLQAEAGHSEEAVRMLQECLDLQKPEPLGLNLLAGLKLKARQYDEAARLFALGEQLDSINLKWTRGLAQVYLLSDNRPKLTDTLTRLARAEPDDLPVRKKLATMALARRDYAAAADWLNQGLQIDVMDRDLHRMLRELLPNWPGAKALLEVIGETEKP